VDRPGQDVETIGGRGLAQPRGLDRGQGPDQAQDRDRDPVQGPALLLRSGQDRGQFRGLDRDPGQDLRRRVDRDPDPAAGRGRFRDRGLVRGRARRPRDVRGQDRRGPDQVPDLALVGRGLVLLPEREATRINLFFFVSFRFFSFARLVRRWNQIGLIVL